MQIGQGKVPQKEFYLQFDWKNETGKKEFKDSPLFIGEF